MTQNQIKEIDIVEELIKNSKDCFELLYNIIIELQGNNDMFSQDSLVINEEFVRLFNISDSYSEKVTNTVYYKINKLLNNCINAIFGDYKSIPTLNNLDKTNGNNFRLLNFIDNNLVLKINFDIFTDYIFDNFHNYIINNDHKIPLKIMEYIPIDQLEYYVNCYINNLKNYEKHEKFYDLFKSFINRKIKSNKKEQINNLIYVLTDKNSKLNLIRNLDSTIFKIIKSDKFEHITEHFYSFNNDNNLIVNKNKNPFDNYNNYIVVKFHNLFLIVDKLSAKNFIVKYHLFDRFILKFNINYFTHIVHYEINVLNNTIHVV